MRGLAILIIGLLAAPSAAQPPSIPPADAPALAALGEHKVGVDELSVPGGKLAKKERTLRVVVWYPARPPAGARPVTYLRKLEPLPPAAALTVRTEGLAVADAPAAAGRYPLVLLSHGFRGWPESMSYLAENLASKGYVVAGIDHGDLPASDAAGFQRSFAVTAMTRARDQQGALAFLTSPRPAAPALGGIDPRRVALIGYSMGGFGALATAGAGYDLASNGVKSLPAGSLDDQLEGRRRPDARLGAVVLIAPWGGQLPHRVWSAAGLQRLRVPALFIAGEEDDISDYRGGIRWLYDQAVNADRRLLLYRSARHNVGGNPSPEEARTAFALRELFDEPVWRHDRLNAINQHFVTAFLDRHLKGDRSKEAMLTPPAAGGEWPGFQKRWALGFTLEAAPPR